MKTQRIAAALCAAACVAAVVRADEIDTLLKAPPDAGRVVLSVEHLADARVQAWWGELLRATDPGVRAAAARLIAVAGTKAAAGAVKAALASENDPRALDELLRAAVNVGEADAALEAARRAGAGALESLATMLVTRRGGDALEHLPALRAGGLASHAQVRFVGQLARRARSTWGVLGALALRERDAGLWSALLEGVEPQRLDAGLLASALRDKPALRDAALFHLAATGAAPDTPLLTEALDGLRQDFGAPGEAPPFALELLDRARGRAPRPDLERMRRVHDGDEPELAAALVRPALLALLTAAERRARTGAREARPPVRPIETKGGPALSLFLASGLWPELVGATLDAARCKPDSEQFAVAAVAFADGRPGRVSGLDTRLAAPCQRAGVRLIAASLAPPSLETPEALIALPLYADLACAVTPRAQRGEAPPRVGGKIREPRKLHQVNPVYPPSARDERLSGLVVLEATIAPSGCITDLRLLRGVDPRLDFAALRAVARWRYTPTLLDGVPVPVIMTVTVNFRLN